MGSLLGSRETAVPYSAHTNPNNRQHIQLSRDQRQLRFDCHQFYLKYPWLAKRRLWRWWWLQYGDSRWNTDRSGYGEAELKKVQAESGS